MKLELMLNFDGNCKQAGEFYSKVFGVTHNNIMTFADAPANPDYPVADVDKDKILYSDITIAGMFVMLMDMPKGTPYIVGNNMSPCLSLDDRDEINRIFNELADGGEINMPLSQTFFSEMYGMVTDPFGVIWQILYYEHEEA